VIPHARQKNRRERLAARVSAEVIFCGRVNLDPSTFGG